MHRETKPRVSVVHQDGQSAIKLNVGDIFEIILTHEEACDIATQLEEALYDLQVDEMAREIPEEHWDPCDLEGHQPTQADIDALFAEE